VLADAGLLDGRRATTHWMYARALADRFPAVEVDAGVLYVTAANLRTHFVRQAGTTPSAYRTAFTDLGRQPLRTRV
jgi:AraC family transcriptional regulator, transcriptional activator FtrA